MKKRVMVFGTFDGLHAGHRNFFAQAARLGDVTAVVARDASVKRIKGKLPHYSERSRLAKVARETKVFKAMLGDKNDFLKIIQKNQPDIIALGFDQKTFTIQALKLNLKKRNLTPQTIRLKSYKPSIFKSSLMRKNNTVKK